MAEAQKPDAKADAEVTTAQPSTPTPPAAQKATPPWVAPAAPEDAEPEEVTQAHQDLIKAEQEYAKIKLAGQEQLVAAQEALIKARAKAAGVDLEAGDFPGYWHKMWGGHDVLQCGYCGWDVITSSLYNYQDRMQEHLAAAHPNWSQMQPMFDSAGNFVEGGVK